MLAVTDYSHLLWGWLHQAVECHRLFLCSGESLVSATHCLNVFNMLSSDVVQKETKNNNQTKKNK